MNPRGRVTFLRLGLLLGITLIGFTLLQKPAREAETRAATLLLQLGGAHGLTTRGADVIVVPAHHDPFRAIVTPSCSSLASALAIGCLASLAPGYSFARKGTAVAVAVGTVVLGNVLRIAGSLAFGLSAGSGTLILFHDSVGNVFSFAYTLFGYILMLYLLLPPSTTLGEPTADVAR